MVSEVLRTAAGVHVLVTSRAGLNVVGEQLLPIGGMAYPDRASAIASAPEHSAVVLFLQSARRVQPGFELTEGNMADVVRVCELVRGMPLGILLAASWLKMLGPAEIADEIERGLDFLETDWRDVPERQRSVRAVFDHSWRLLSEREQEVLAALSAFRGGCTRESAQAVTGASLRELLSLVNRSLLQRTGEGRYELHELLRQYAAEKLAQMPDGEEAVRDRHSAHYAAALERWAADLKGSRQQVALAEVEADLENARAAWRWAIERGSVERLDQAIEGLGLFYEWQLRYAEGEAAFREAAGGLAATAQQVPDRGLRVLAKALAWQGRFVCLRRRYSPARPLLERGLALLDDPRLADQDTRAEKALVLWAMGWLVHRGVNPSPV